MSLALASFIVLGSVGLAHIAHAQTTPVREVPGTTELEDDPLIDVVITPRLEMPAEESMKVLAQALSASPSGTGTPVLDDLASAQDEARQLLADVETSIKKTIVLQVKTSDAQAFREGRLSEEGLLLKYPSPKDVVDNREDRNTVVVDRNVGAGVTEQALVLLSRISSAEAEFGNLENVLLGDTTHLEDLGDDELDVMVASSLHDAAVTERLRRVTGQESGLVGQSNGLVDSGLLSELSWAPGYYLHAGAAQMLELLNADFKAEMGYDLPIISTYRPLSVQYEVHTNDPNMTAVPGYSNHGLGLAVDIGAEGGFIDYGSPEHVWMLDNGPRYGWMHPSWARAGSDRPEPWHFEFATFYKDPSFGVEFNNQVSPPYRAYWSAEGRPSG